MSDSWFVDPEEMDRKDLPSGGWVIFKHELAYGERERLSGASFTTARSVQIGDERDLQYDVDMGRFRIERLATWLVEWSVKEKISRASIAALRPKIADEIHEVLDRHIEALEAANADPKGESSAEIAPAGSYG